jgi:hypothetical protein
MKFILISLVALALPVSMEPHVKLPQLIKGDCTSAARARRTEGEVLTDEL